jgi:hypothetical protein
LPEDALARVVLLYGNGGKAGDFIEIKHNGSCCGLDCGFAHGRREAKKSWEWSG